MAEIGRFIAIAGVVLLAAGLLLMSGAEIGLGHLPGDFVFRRGNMTIFIPLGTSLLLSALITLVFWLFRR